MAAEEGKKEGGGEMEDFGHRNYRRRDQVFFCFLKQKNFHLLIPRCFFASKSDWVGTNYVFIYLTRSF